MNKSLKYISWLIIALFCSSLIKNKTIDLIWKFDNYSKLTYEFKSTDKWKTNMGLSEYTRNYSETSGIMSIITNGDKPAKIILSNFIRKSCKISSNNDTSLIEFDTLPTKTIDGYMENSIFLSDSTESKNFKGILFPNEYNIPINKPYKQNQTRLIEVFGTKSDTYGTNTILVKKESANILKINSEFDFSKFKSPKDSSIFKNYYNRGKTSFEYLRNEGYYDSGYTEREWNFETPALNQYERRTASIKLISNE